MLQTAHGGIFSIFVLHVCFNFGYSSALEWSLLKYNVCKQLVLGFACGWFFLRLSHW